jgi:phosphatidylserine/phosphatidylglycerophosphate/cardiolipin synthase-like enzyme
VNLLKWPLEKRRKGLTGEPGLLHAKFAIGDSARLLVTSANLTENALTRNVEMGLLVSGPAAARVAAHLRALQEKGVLVPY